MKCLKKKTSEECWYVKRRRWSYTTSTLNVLDNNWLRLSVCSLQRWTAKEIPNIEQTKKINKWNEFSSFVFINVCLFLKKKNLLYACIPTEFALLFFVLNQMYKTCYFNYLLLKCLIYTFHQSLQYKQYTHTHARRHTHTMSTKSPASKKLLALSSPCHRNPNSDQTSPNPRRVVPNLRVH